MQVPITLKVAVLTLAATAFYTYVGQMVPQKEVHPPEVVEIGEDVGTERMVEIGKEIFEGKGLCSTCHTIGKSGALRFPDLDGIATRAGAEIPGMDALTYLAQSIYEPDEYIVPGFNPGMPAIDKPPIALSDDEIRTVIAYLQTLGGEATITMATVLPYSEGAAEVTATEPEVTATSAGEVTVAPTAEEPRDVPAAVAAGTALLARYGCDGCHAAGAEAAPLTGVGRRLSRAQILSSLTDHRPPLPETYTGRVTLSEIRSMTDYLTTLEGGG